MPGFGNHDCTKQIADGTIDILVNIAVNKGHSDWNGNATLTMKNHYGTFSPDNHGPDVKFVTGPMKSPAIIGGWGFHLGWEKRVGSVCQSGKLHCEVHSRRAVGSADDRIADVVRETILN